MRARKRIENQAIGLLPLLLFMILDNYLSYKLSFVVGIIVCALCLSLYQTLSKGRIYHFMLLQSGLTLILYSIFFTLSLEPVLFIYSPLITEVLLVVVLAFCGFTKRLAFSRLRASNLSAYERSRLHSTLSEFYFVVQLTQSLYTLHLFAVLLYSIFPEHMTDLRTEYLLHRVLGILIGLFVIFYEQLRISFMRERLQKEVWLPVLGDNGKVIGCIARSVSQSLRKKYYHPVVRIVVVCQGMLYLVKRAENELVSPIQFDHPLRSYVLFRKSIEQTVKDLINQKIPGVAHNLRFLVRYTFENDRVKHLVSLYTLRVTSEEQLKHHLAYGKLWTIQQIETNKSKGVFSEYFEKEYPYLRSTVLLADNRLRQSEPTDQKIPVVTGLSDNSITSKSLITSPSIEKRTSVRTL